MDSSPDSYEDLVEKFFSRSATRDLVLLIKQTYETLLTRAAKMPDFSSKGDDVEVARNFAKDSVGSDLYEACKLFDNVKLGYSHSPFWTRRLITSLMSKGGSQQHSKRDKESKILTGYFFEFQAICLGLLQHRNARSHDSASRISHVEAAFLSSSVARAFELSALIHQALKKDEPLPGKAEYYATRLKESLMEPSTDAYSEVSAGTEVRTDPSQGHAETMGLLKDIAEALKPIGEAVETLSDESPKKFKNLSKALTTKNSAVMSKLSQLSAALEKTRREWNQTYTSDDDFQKASLMVTPRSGASSITQKTSKQDAERELVGLRDRIFVRMANEIDGFKHYHNVLQRPLIHAAISAHCGNLESLQALPEFQQRMGRNPPAYRDRQLELFGSEIDALLSSIDFGVTSAAWDAGSGFDDDIPF